MKKVLFALPFLIFGIAGCSHTTLGVASGLTAKKVTSITLTYYSSQGNQTFVVLDEYLADVAKNLLNLGINRETQQCKCRSLYQFTLTTKNATYLCDAYSFSGENVGIYYTCNAEDYDTIVSYTIERS